MLSPLPFVVTDSGDPADAPQGALPISLYGGGGGGGGVQDTGYQILEMPDLPGLDSGNSENLIRRAGNQVYVFGYLTWTEPTTIDDITDEPGGFAFISSKIPQEYTPATGIHNSGHAVFIQQQSPLIRKAGAVAIQWKMRYEDEGTFEDSLIEITPIEDLTTFQAIKYGISWFTANPFPAEPVLK